MSQLSTNAFLAYLASSLQSSGSETTIYLDRISTLTGEDIATTDFAVFGRGTITLDPLSSTDIEFASFTGVDATDVALTGTIRGLSAKSNTSSTSRMPYHPVGTPVIISFGVHNLEDLKDYIDDLIAGTIGNASASVAGVTKLSVAPVSPTNPIAVGDNDPRLPTTAQGVVLAAFASAPGFIFPYGGRSAPTGYLMCDGTAVSRATYVNLFAVLAPSGTFTVTIASPGVFSKTAHGYVAGDRIHFTTTGALPTGLAVNTDYFVIASGLTADAFQVAATPAGTVIATSGSQSGTHTVYASAFGKGDGSTTFNVPDLRAKMPIGLAATAPTTTLTFSGAQRSSNAITILNTVFPSQGQLVQLTTTGALPTGLSLATDYYIVRVSSTTISFATSQANANTGTVVTLSADGSGINTMTFTNRTHTVLGRIGGEETHGISRNEAPLHTHTASGTATTGGAGGGGSLTQATVTTSSAGNDETHNNMSPFVITNYVIKY